MPFQTKSFISRLAGTALSSISEQPKGTTNDNAISNDITYLFIAAIILITVNLQSLD